MGNKPQVGMPAVLAALFLRGPGPRLGRTPILSILYGVTDPGPTTRDPDLQDAQTTDLPNVSDVRTAAGAPEGTRDEDDPDGAFPGNVVRHVATEGLDFVGGYEPDSHDRPRLDETVTLRFEPLADGFLVLLRENAHVFDIRSVWEMISLPRDKMPPKVAQGDVDEVPRRVEAVVEAPPTGVHPQTDRLTRLEAARLETTDMIDDALSEADVLDLKAGVSRLQDAHIGRLTAALRIEDRLV